MAIGKEMFMEPLSSTIRRRAHDLGFTDLRFDLSARTWAWHKPDQVIGEDGRIYVRHRSA